MKTEENNIIKITIDRQYLFDEIAPALGSHLQLQRRHALERQNSQSQENCGLQ
jgi:hypothetical protein